jgi:hypothetical protein
MSKDERHSFGPNSPNLVTLLFDLELTGGL